MQSTSNYVASGAYSGVCAHSSPAHGETYVIFCVGQSKVRQQAFKAWALDKGIGFKELVGSYKGQQETSFITNHKNLDEILVWIVEEESILILGPSKYLGGGKSIRQARLVFGNGDEVALGNWRQVHKDHALAQEAWTFDPSQNAYFVADGK